MVVRIATLGSTGVGGTGAPTLGSTGVGGTGVPTLDSETNLEQGGPNFDSKTLLVDRGIGCEGGFTLDFSTVAISKMALRV